MVVAVPELMLAWVLIKRGAQDTPHKHSINKDFSKHTRRSKGFSLAMARPTAHLEARQRIPLRSWEPMQIFTTLTITTKMRRIHTTKHCEAKPSLKATRWHIALSSPNKCMHEAMALVQRN